MQRTAEMFDKRNQNKKELQNSYKDIQTNVGEIRMYKVGVNLGNEVSKGEPFMRPGIIINHIGGDLVLIAPLTSQDYNGKYITEILNSNTYGLLRTSYVLINQTN